MDRWTEFQVFVKIAEERSMTRAAEVLNSSTSGVSRQLTNLESRLGVRLIQRSTRQLSLTDEGERLYGQARDLLSTWEEAEANVSLGSHAPTGRLRVGGQAAMTGVIQRGQYLISINQSSTLRLNYNSTMQQLRNASRPLLLVLVNPITPNEMTAIETDARQASRPDASKNPG